MPFKKFLYLLPLLFVYLAPRAQVNLQTGSAVFSIPMFNWKDNKSRLYNDVTLSYNSGNGLRVNEVASKVGQGWNLVAGGVITRMQVGEPDDQVARETSDDHDITRYPAGFLYAPVPADNGCPQALTKYPIYKAKNQLYTQHNSTAEDRQLDYFSFQFNGKAGLFILDTTGGDHGIPLGDTKMKITFQRDPTVIAQGIVRTTITSFTIQDVDGLIYKFSMKGLTKVLNENFCDGNVTQTLDQPKFESNNVYFQAGFDLGTFKNPWVVGSWHLSEIDDPFTGRRILFNYTIRNINNIAGYDISYNSNNHQYVIVSYKTSITQTPELDSINYPDSHTVILKYGTTERIDLKGEYPLAAVDVTYSNRFLSKYQLNTSYFILNRYGTPATDYQKRAARLCLRSVKKIGVDLKEDSPPYLFDYYMGSNNVDDFVPPPFFYAKDIWGYFNGNNSVGYNNVAIPLNTVVSQLDFNSTVGLCFLNNTVTSGPYLNAKAGYAKNGLLRQIIYPTGGTLTYQYDQNVGMLNSVNTVVGGVHVSQTSSTDGGYSNGCANPVTTQYNYVMNGAGSASSLWGLEMPVNTLTISNHYQPEDRKWRWRLSCGIFGCCYWRYQFPGILSEQEAVGLTDFQKFMEAAAPVLGILSIVSDIIDVVNLVCGSSGFFAWAAVIVDFIGGVVSLLVSCTGSQVRDTNNSVYYNFDLNGISPLPVQFKRVEVVENPGTIGKTVQEFTSSDDYPIWAPTNPTFSAKQRFAPWAYGLPKLITVYDSAGYKVKETKNVYNTYFAQGQLDRGMSLKLPKYILSCKCVVNKSSSQRNVYWEDQTRYNDPTTFITGVDPTGALSVDLYGMYTGRVLLDTTYERIFRPNNSTLYTETFTAYRYNYSSATNYEAWLISSMQSNGDVNNKYIRYTVDYNTGILSTLVQNNIVNLPVETMTKVMKAGATSELSLKESVTEYLQVSNGDIRPSRMLEQRLNQPGNLGTYAGPGSNTSAYKQLQTFTYDANSNLTGLADEGGRTVSNIYDYNDKYIVATVINVDTVVDKPAYTSFETNTLGGWAMSGSGQPYLNNSGVTGSRAFSLQNNSLSAPLNPAKVYTLSFWASSSALTIGAGATLSKSGPVINGFTYYEFDVPSSSSSVAISGSATIDELRLYPKTARMHTTVFDPLIGKTAECDENNRITYYEYDNLGRMRFIKDENGNALKMYEYNTVSSAKQNGCPGNYTNRPISEFFTKSTCGAGYLGAQVAYTVPAAKYSSVISQADADAQAENELYTSGQANADASAGNCSLLYYNTARSETDTTQTCAVGYVGGGVTYTVPAGRYYSTISQADADQKAINEIAANAIGYANTHPVCVISYDPDWTYQEGAPTYCQSVNGQLPPHLFVYETDLNPNSSSYLQTRWSDVGPQDDCPANFYYNVGRSQAFTKVCPVGYTGSQVTYSVPPGKYNSIISQADADQKAINDINANGQNYANANGTCVANVNVEGYNQYASDYNVIFYNKTTGITYGFTLSANTYGPYPLGAIPTGTYKITFYPMGFAVTANFSINMNNTNYYNYYGTGAVFDNVSITGLTTASMY